MPEVPADTPQQTVRLTKLTPLTHLTRLAEHSAAASEAAVGAAAGTRRAPHSPALGPVPVLRHRRDGILPAVAAALSAGGQTLTSTGSRATRPPQLHPLVQEFLDSLDVQQRERYTGRCPEAMVLSRYLTVVENSRGKRAGRKPLSRGEVRRALKNAKLTARRIREDGDPWHGSYAPPCRSCAALLAHFGVRTVDPAAGRTETPTRG